jgi:hypothetical protein
MCYLSSVIIDRNHVLVGLHLGIDSHSVEPFVSGTSDEAESGQLVLTLPLGLIVARGRRAVIVGVVVEVTEGGEEGTHLGLGLLEVLLLERLLIESSLSLVLRGVLVLVLVLARVILVKGVLVLLGVVGDEVVGVSTAITSFL